MQKQKIKVIYLAGSGRSGSTILNIILGNHPQIFGGGELQNMCTVYNTTKICSCQAHMVNCKFWSAVMNDWISKVKDDDIHSALKKWSNFEGVFSLKAWLRIYFGIGIRSKQYREYLDSTSKFYQTILQHSKKEIVVDISKNPLRALALERNPDIDLRMVHLVRDGRAVAWSLKKNAKQQKRNRPIWRAAMFWVVINRMTNIVRAKVEHTTVIKYEDFVKNPGNILNQIGLMSDVDFSCIIDKITENDDFEIKHVMAGNAIRKASTVKFQTTNSDSWKQKLKTSSIKLFRIMAFNSLRKHNYI